MRLLQPERLETILASVLDRRQERAERRRTVLRDQPVIRAKSRMLPPCRRNIANSI